MSGRGWLVLLALVAFPALTGCYVDRQDPGAERLRALPGELEDGSRLLHMPAGSLSLADAVGFAMENNLAIRAAELEYAVEHEIKTGEALKALPSLRAGLGLFGRNKPYASSSESLSSGRQSLEPSFSSENVTNPLDLTVAWSLLDLGLGVVRSRQAGERELIAAQKLRRLRQQIALDVAVAYYRLCAAEEIIERAASLETALRMQLDVFRDGSEARHISDSERARRSAPLLAGLRTLRGHRRERELARANLAKAMGSALPDSFTPAGDWPRRLPDFNVGPDDLHARALLNRPEMFSADSDVRISLHEARAALLQLAPNVNLSASLQHNGDKFLVYHNWMEAALQVSWDLLRFPAKRREVRTARQRAELADMRRRVTAASIMLQVNLAMVEYAEGRDRLALAEEIEENRLVILRGVEDGAEKGRGHGADILLERLQYLSEAANRCWTLSDCLAARARLLSALGEDFDAGRWRVVEAVAVGRDRPAAALADKAEAKPSGGDISHAPIVRRLVEAVNGGGGGSEKRAGLRVRDGVVRK